MTPANGGRHCAACQKTVVDFTQKTDAEILAYLAQATGRTCGRFRAEQLGQPLRPAHVASNRWRTWLGALLAAGSLGQLAASKAAAQPAMRGMAGPLPLATTSATKPAAPTSRQAVGPAAIPTAGSRTLSGTVRDEATHEPLPGATVLLKGTQLGATADTDGKFVLAVPGDAPTAQLVFVYIGYKSAEQTVALPNHTPLAVLLSADSRVLSGDIVIIPAKRPWPWHPRRLYQWSKYWLSRPFQQ
jgi:hypothetical protein